MAQDSVRLAGLFQLVDLFVRQLNRERRNGIIQMMGLTRTDNGAVIPGLAKNQASATCTFATPRFFAISPARSATEKSSSW